MVTVLPDTSPSEASVGVVVTVTVVPASDVLLMAPLLSCSWPTRVNWPGRVWKYSSRPPLLSVRLSAMRMVLPSGLTQNWLVLGKLPKVSRAVGNDVGGLTMAWPPLVGSGAVLLTR